MLSTKVVLVPDTFKFPPMYVSFPMEIPPPKVIDPPVPTPVAFAVSSILIGSK